MECFVWYLSNITTKITLSITSPFKKDFNVTNHLWKPSSQSMSFRVLTFFQLTYKLLLWLHFSLVSWWSNFFYLRKMSWKKKQKCRWISSVFRSCVLILSRGFSLRDKWSENSTTCGFQMVIRRSKNPRYKEIINILVFFHIQLKNDIHLLDQRHVLPFRNNCHSPLTI